MAKAKDAEVYEVPALTITPGKAPVVTGNYEAIEKTLEKWKAKVLKMDLTEDNLSEVQTIKSAAVAVRNSLDRTVEATKKMLFNDPKKIFEARVKLLFSLIAEVESKADTVLDKIDQERRDSINEVLDHYKTEFQKKYQLDDQHLAHIEYRKNYYNKGMEEKTRKDDLEQQFKDLKKAQDAHNAGIMLIQAVCKGEPRLNAERYIRDFDSGVDVAIVVDEINAEKRRLTDLDSNTATETTTETAGATTVDETCEEGEPADEETEKIVIGAAEGIDFGTDFPGRVKKMKLQLSYPCDLGDALTQLFEKLRPYGIKIKQIHEEVAF